MNLKMKIPFYRMATAFQRRETAFENLGRRLFGGEKKKTNKAEGDAEQNGSNRIAVFGPGKAGKTWLINALGKGLDTSTRRQANYDYVLLDAQRDVLGILPLLHEEPTRTPGERKYYLVCTGKKDKTKGFEEALIIVDSPGEETKNLASSMPSDRLIRRLRILNSAIYLLDPISLTNNGGERDETEVSDEFVHFANKIIQNSIRPFYLAVCVSKIDRFNELRYQSATQSIDNLFGDTMRRAIRHVANHLVVQEFVTSSSGYIKTGHDSNWQDGKPGSLGLIDHVNWAPVNVADPFIWIIEHQSKSNLKRYLEPLKQYT